MAKTLTLADKHDERRAHQRITSSVLAVKIDNKVYETDNWSMGGFQISGFKGSLSTGSLLTISALGANRKTLSDVEIRARVVRADATDHKLAVCFLGVNDQGHQLLGQFMSMRG